MNRGARFGSYQSRNGSAAPAGDAGAVRLEQAHQIHLLRTSFAVVESHPRIAALIFYQHLFEIDPSLRAMFHTEIEAQAEKLMDMLARAIALLDQPAELDRILRALGARHMGYGVVDAHYATVGRALLRMLAEVLDARWTPEVREAWMSLYDQLSTAMKAGAAESLLGTAVPGHSGRSADLKSPT